MHRHKSLETRSLHGDTLKNAWHYIQAWSAADQISNVKSNSSGRTLTVAEATMRGGEQLAIDYYAQQGLNAAKNRGISPDNPHRQAMLDLATDRATKLHGIICPH